MVDLFGRSIQIIEENQYKSGAYYACPSFPTYQFSWLRDGAFTAYAMDRVGNHVSAARFYRWVGRTIQQHVEKVDRISVRIKKGMQMRDGDFLHTRYTVEGQEVPEDSGWGNFQIDGYGTWLWGLGEHLHLTGDVQLAEELKDSVAATIRYIHTVWCLPNYDCWEEFPEYVHTYSLAAIYGGLGAVEHLIPMGLKDLDVSKLSDLREQILDYVEKRAVWNGRLLKMSVPGSDLMIAPEHVRRGVDASLIGAAVPYGMFNLNDSVILQTISAVQRELMSENGGVYRYTEDRYYGGGEWILLSAWYGWYLARSGRVEEAKELLGWIEAQAAEDGSLPEQVSSNLLHPETYDEWVQRWGAVASPLVWSHAMYLILACELRDQRSH